MRKLFNLLASNARKGSFRAEGNTIYIYDVIVGSDAEAEFWGGVSPEAFARTLSGLSGDVTLRINSPGGDVFAARAMVAAMSGYAGQITAHVDGYAASAASLIAVSAGRTIMADGSFLMIHKAWTFAMGNADDLVSTAALLEKVDSTIAETYAAKAGTDAAGFAQMMTEETWFTAEEAVNIGLADERQANSAKKGAQAAWNLSAYRAAPAQPTPEPQPAATSEPAMAEPTDPEIDRRRRLVALRSVRTAA
jgi:ATP-dependent Clp protease, protease subunit